MKFERIALSILAMFPWKSVAFVADARLTALEGEEAVAQNNWRTRLTQKELLFGPNIVLTTPEQAYLHFLDRSGLQDQSEAVSQFNALVDKMLQDGTIKMDEKLFVSEIPSRAGY